MTRAELVEAMARASHAEYRMRHGLTEDNSQKWENLPQAVHLDWMADATAALAAIEAAGVVCVPREPTLEMRRAFHGANDKYENHGIGESPDSQWSAMLAASPLAQEPGR